MRCKGRKTWRRSVVYMTDNKKEASFGGRYFWVKASTTNWTSIQHNKVDFSLFVDPLYLSLSLNNYEHFLNPNHIQHISFHLRWEILSTEVFCVYLWTIFLLEFIQALIVHCFFIKSINIKDNSTIRAFDTIKIPILPISVLKTHANWYRLKVEKKAIYFTFS